MKKRHLLITMAILLCLFFCCGCTDQDPLAFKKNFYEGDNEPNSGYTETLKYDVTFSPVESYKDKLSFKNGSLTTTLKVIPSIESVSEIADNDILKERPSGAETVYYYKTEFKINPTYSGISYDKLDTIVTECYFCSQRLSYAPIYSTYTAHYSMYASTAQEVGELDVKCTINYSTKYYIVNTDIDGEQETTQYKYKFQSVIDNNQLLFIVRNIAVDQKTTLNLPVVSLSYGSPKKLAFKDDSQITYTNAVNYNGKTQNAIAVQNLSFSISDASAQGLGQNVYIQTKQDDIPFNAVLCKYVAPLLDYSGFANIGNLEYNLTSVSFNN